jgi:hypothetical protein
LHIEYELPFQRRAERCDPGGRAEPETS